MSFKCPVCKREYVSPPGIKVSEVICQHKGRAEDRKPTLMQPLVAVAK